MDQQYLDLMADLYRPLHRQGPGSDASTKLAMQIAGLDPKSHYEVADIGCGTGAASLLLAQDLDAHITAIDFLSPFVEELTIRAQKAGLTDRVTARVRDMTDLPFAPQSLDVIWSEGAIYNMGFAAGIRYWQQFLKPGGIMAVSELSWTGSTRPKDITDFWQNAYAETDTVSAKTAILENAGLSPVGHFLLPANCWTDEFYTPLTARLPAFLADHGDMAAASGLASEHKDEAALYDRFGRYYSYGFYIARKPDPAFPD